ncbi:MAG: phosphomannomutase/phosphoglucomutase [Gammaproteobacteria bacterium]|nr:MAG: phosphomannomutase/phosphoglucomutase [Gammaproteobacteria bacterium]
MSKGSYRCCNISINPGSFREYDIRGVADVDLHDDFAYTLGRAYADRLREAGGQTVAVGRDCRLSGQRLQTALITGLVEGGAQVHSIGMVPTPLLYFSVHHLDLDGGIQITGSHNPAEYNGFKMMLGKDSVHGEQIQDLLNRMQGGAFTSGKGESIARDIVPDYLNYVTANIALKRPLKIVVDGGNGAGGQIGAELYRRLGCDVIELYCEPDGSFPNHHPDPTVEENLVDIRRAVVQHGADLGIAFDGDADRIGAIDETGQIIWGDMLMVLFSRQVLQENPGAAIISEVKCSRNLYNDIEAHGGQAIMWKTGHSLIKSKMKETGAKLAGEMSGHIFFADRYFGFDDAPYVGARLCELLSASDRTLTGMLANLPKTKTTPEIRVDCPDNIKFGIVEKARQHFGKDYNLIDIDGIRIEFDDGWALLRASNTQPVLVLRFEAETEERLQELRQLLEGWLKQEIHS